MKTIKVSEATELQLDWLVATCEGHLASVTKSGEVAILREGITDYFDPHRNWGWAGPIKERQGISSGPAAGGGFWAGKCPINDGETLGMEGLTELIAIARCYVASVMGETVEVPEELL